MNMLVFAVGSAAAPEEAVDVLSAWNAERFVEEVRDVYEGARN